MLPFDQRLVAAFGPRQTVGDPLQLGFHVHDGRENEQHFVEQGAVPIRARVLLEITEPGGFGAHDAAGLRSRFARQDTEQRGFPAAVRADQADFVPIPDIEGHAFEQALFTEIFGDVLYR